jgi:Fic family protein
MTQESAPALTTARDRRESPISVLDGIAETKGRKGRLDKLRQIFAARQRLTRVEIIDFLSVSPMTATNYLSALCRNGEIEKIEPTKAPRTHYFMHRRPLSKEEE